MSPMTVLNFRTRTIRAARAVTGTTEAADNAYTLFLAFQLSAWPTSVVVISHTRHRPSSGASVSATRGSLSIRYHSFAQVSASRMRLLAAPSRRRRWSQAP